MFASIWYLPNRTTRESQVDEINRFSCESALIESAKYDVYRYCHLQVYCGLRNHFLLINLAIYVLKHGENKMYIWMVHVTILGDKLEVYTSVCEIYFILTN